MLNLKISIIKSEYYVMGVLCYGGIISIISIEKVTIQKVGFIKS